MTAGARDGDTALSARSAVVRDARALHRRRERDARGLLLVEGPQALREALHRTLEDRDGPGSLRRVLHRAEAKDHPVVQRARGVGVQVLEVTDAALATVAESVTPQGLVGVARRVVDDLRPETVPAASGLVLVLADVQDPGNTGACVRVADAVGADAVVVVGAGADPEGGKAVRASAGSLFHLPVLVHPGSARALDLLREAGLRVVGLDGSAAGDLVEANATKDLRLPLALVVGNEGAGLGEDVTGRCESTVRIPIYGRAESLNVATAAAVAAYSVRAAVQAGGSRS